MSFDKFYPNRKDHRTPYRGAKSVSTGCRNHGSCEWCKSNRLYSRMKQEQAAEQELQDWLNGVCEHPETAIRFYV